MSDMYFDSLETRAPEVREASQFSLLADLVRRVMAESRGWAARLDGVVVDDLHSRAALAQLPLTRKSDLKAAQENVPPLGALTASAMDSIGRIFSSPGPIYEPEGRGADWWRSARALYAAGIRRGDIVHNTFAYHLTPGGWIMDAGARALGCTVIPAGPGNTEQQLAAIAHLRPVAYVGVPDYLKILLDKSDEAGSDTSSIRKALVSGGALFPSLRQEYGARGIACLQCYATADVGLIAYETQTPDGPCQGMMIDEGVIVEIVRPGTGDPVPDGDVGEVVVTSFNRDYPMIRLATGDLSAVLAGPSPCGRTNTRIKGWLGRADQTTKVKGMFVHPEQVAQVGARHSEVGKLRLVISRDGEQDLMTLQAECADGGDGLAAQIGETLLAITKIRGEVVLVPPGSLENDGKVIDDQRSYD